AVAALVIGSNGWIVFSARGRVYDSVEEIEARPVGIVLGTSKNVAKDRPNPHFENRLKAAAALYQSGKVGGLLVSGHRDSKYYDEPRDMEAKLKALGVPASAISADSSGARTLDSMVRAHEVFGLSNVTVISDDFHVGRALFIADRAGLDAIAFRCEPVPIDESVQARVREYFARVKAVLDLYLLHRPAAATRAKPVEKPATDRPAQ
ncbi:MAG: YdcF family protein, partial [Verrucomicrobiae bacterium]|nr:YdcF family protein [Verrucomicrobiae bacterium]